MGLRINTNLGSLSAQRQLGQSQRKLETNLRQLASGDRFSDPLAGAGDYAIAEKLKGQIKGQKAAQFNAENAISFVQIAEGGLNEQTNILIRLRELAVQSASDTFGDGEREMLDMEFQQLKTEFDRIANTTQFGSHKLLSGDDKTYEFQVGVYKGDDNVIRYDSNTDTTASAAGISGLSVSDHGDARDALEDIDTAINHIAKARANFGAVQSRLQSVANNNAIQVENLEAARSRIADTDVAEATAEMFKNQALQHFQVSVLAQANQTPLSVLKLVA